MHQDPGRRCPGSAVPVGGMGGVLNVLDLFSGIGGFSLGLERAGMTTVAFCEVEDFPRKVLAKHWPAVPCYPDVRELTKEILDADGITADLICGGYPCQPFSAAGKRGGAEDDRHLWPEMYRLVKTIKPRWVLAENVAGHISMGLDDVLLDLENAGYAWWTFVIPACAKDARHRRDRVWIVGNSENRRLEGRGTQPDSSKARGSKKQSLGAGTGSGVVADSIKPGLEGQSGHGKDRNQPGRDRASEERPVSAAGVFGGGATIWPTEPNFCRVAYGIPQRVDRLKALGNAVVPQVVEQIGRFIMEAER